MYIINVISTFGLIDNFTDLLHSQPLLRSFSRSLALSYATIPIHCSFFFSRTHLNIYCSGHLIFITIATIISVIIALKKTTGTLRVAASFNSSCRESLVSTNLRFAACCFGHKLSTKEKLFHFYHSHDTVLH